MSKQNLNIGTLNVRGLNAGDNRRNIFEDLIKYDLDILSITETHIKEEEYLEDFKNKYTLFSTNKVNDSHHGVGFLIKTELDPTFSKITERICFADMKTRNQTIRVVSVYAPTLKSCEDNPEIRLEFYAAIQKVIKTTPKRYSLIIAGDFNAKVGSAWKSYPECLGRFGKGAINSSGKILVEMCHDNNLCITNTLFKHRLSHVTTWEAPERNFTTHDGTPRRNIIRNQIDFIIVRQRQRQFVTNSRSYGGISTETDHKLVKMNINFKLSKLETNKTKKRKYQLLKLRNT